MKHLDAFDRYIPNRQSRQKYKQMSVNPNDRHVFGIIYGLRISKAKLIFLIVTIIFFCISRSKDYLYAILR